MRKNSPHKLILTGLIVLVTLSGQISQAQTASNGEIKGTVTDPSGAAVSGVKVGITNVQTGVTNTTETNASGIYDAPSVPIGEYRITFSKAGFRDFVRQGVNLQLQTIAIDATLQVGAATEQVVVTAEAPLVQTETSDQQVNLDNKAVMDAPIVGGVWFTELTKVLPGVGGGAAAGGESVAVNGTQAFSANFQIAETGVTAPREVNVSENSPPIDAIQEVTINTANAGAQNGNGALSLNVNLKSGTNRWHGSAFEFVQNDIFESKNYFNTGKKAPVRWNEFGGSIGGPIKKDKLFFYFTYHRNPAKAGNFYTTTVPTDAMRNGDFSDPSLFHATVYDPSSCSPAPSARTPLNGGSNILLVAPIDPVPSPTLPTIPLAPP